MADSRDGSRSRGASCDRLPVRHRHCDPDLADTAAFCQHYGYALDDSANAILVAGKSEERPVVCCVVLASTRLDVNGVVRKRLGSRKASFASPEETMERSGGMMIGGVTPFGLPGDSGPIDALVMSAQVIVGGEVETEKTCARPRQSLRCPLLRCRSLVNHRLAVLVHLICRCARCRPGRHVSRLFLVRRLTGRKLDRTLATCGRRAIWVRWIRS